MLLTAKCSVLMACTYTPSLQNTREIKRLQRRVFRCGSTGSAGTGVDAPPGMDAAANSGQHILVQVLHQVAAVLNECVPGGAGAYSESLASASPCPTTAWTPGAVTPGGSVPSGWRTAAAGAHTEQPNQQQIEGGGRKQQENEQQQQAAPDTPGCFIPMSQNMEGLILAKDALAQQASC